MQAPKGVAGPRIVEPALAPTESRAAAVSEVRRVAELLPHPDLVKHTRGYSTPELSQLTERGEAAFADPITVTHENVIIDGYAVWELAKLQRRQTLTCIVRQMTREDALLHLLTRNRGSKGICEYARVLMALELEPWFRERAKSNQRTGGRDKGSTRLAEADKLDVRIEVARAAGVSAGNVSKVKHILQSAIPDIRQALLAGEIRINRAAQWARAAESTQARRLSDYRNEHGIRRSITTLLSKHQKRHPAMCDGLRDVQRGLTKLREAPCLSPLIADISPIVRKIDGLLRGNEVERAA